MVILTDFKKNTLPSSAKNAGRFHYEALPSSAKNIERFYYEADKKLTNILEQKVIWK